MNSTESDPIARALEAVPAVAPGTEVRTGSNGRVYLRREMKKTNPLLRWLGARDFVHIDLDERGSWFWKQIDGTCSLEGIARKMRKEFSIEEQVARETAIGFARMLLLRNLILLKTRHGAPSGARQLP